jgi:hypothetical protein
MRVSIESVHTGQIFSLHVSPRVSIQWILDKAKVGAGVRDLADAGAFQKLRIKWILVQAEAEAFWQGLSASDQRSVLCLVSSADGTIRPSKNPLDRLVDLSPPEDVVFHLHGVPIPDNEFDRSDIAYCRIDLFPGPNFY